jgi:flagellar capping protein FliD
LSFTGISQFSNDFQTILNRAVAIAQLPVTALQNQQANILQEKQLSTSFETAVSALAATVTNLGAIGASQAMGATSSDTSKVTIASTSATSPASYSITNITSGSRGSVRNLRDWIRQLHGHAGFEQRYGEVGSGRQF